MGSVFRFVAGLASALLVCGPVAAQPPVAPEPHLSFDELVKEYKRLGLPLPPPNAEFVRIKYINRYLLDFHVPPLGPDVEPIKPGSDILKGVKPEWASDLLWLAIQCRIRGLNEPADILYARVRQAIETPEPPQKVVLPLNGVREGFFQLEWKVRSWEKGNLALIDELQRTASQFWRPQIMELGSDRKEVLRYLKVIHPAGHRDIRDLELTIAPRKSKPGSVEFLIDGLTDFWTSNGNGGAQYPRGEEKGEEAYWKLAELGFDAVPALLEHIEDPRFTRHIKVGTDWGNLKPIPSYRVRVGHVVSWLLDEFSGRELDVKWEDMVNAAAARRWWENAKKVGEEKWLVDHTLLANTSSGQSSSPGSNFVILRALRAKYPNRLGEVYRALLQTKEPVFDSGLMAKEIAVSKLPRKQKLALLEEGSTHKQVAHRQAALSALADVDMQEFQNHLIATLKWFPSDIEGSSYWGCPEAEMVTLVQKTDDPACWDALTAAAKRASVGLRMEIISQMRWSDGDTQDKLTQRKRLRFLLQFLDDQSARGKMPPANKMFGSFDAAGGSTTAQVRDLAAVVLAQLLGWQVKFDPERSPLARFMIRVAVKQEAAKELARLEK